VSAGQGGLLESLRVGFGFDIHRFELGVPLFLGGVRLDHEYGLVSHTDGDAVCHALLDALFTACGLPDIGTHFPPSDARLRGVSSLELLRETASELFATHIAAVLNITLTIMAEAPKIGPYRERMAASLAGALGIMPQQIAIAAGTNERFDAVGRGEALAVFANVLLVLKSGTGALAHDKEREVNSVAAAEMPPPQIGIGSSELSEEDYLPERVKQFERAVQTKLPPLPKADPPKPGSELILYTDGASRGNPGAAAAGWVLFDAGGMLVHEDGQVLGTMTNNEAEYAALMLALQWVEANLGQDYKLTLRMDSELAVKQLRGEYKVKAENLRQTVMLAMAQLAGFSALTIQHVPRAENSRADALANRALDEAAKGPH
jgi:2-C-methyl-D-erythritol 2,4-cyclodiphosphate synthase